MRDLPPVARRVSAWLLALGLLLSAFPLTVAAEDGAPVSVRDAFEVSDDASDTAARFEWTITAPDELWSLEAATMPGRSIQLVLRDAEGYDLGSARGDEQASLVDRALAPGTYSIEIPRASEVGSTFELRAWTQSERFDPEPNDRPEEAVPITDGTTARGRLARAGNDHYRLSVPPGDDLLRDITLVPEGEADRSVCLLTPEGERVQCRWASDVPLRDLALAPGEHILQVSGSVAPAEAYQLRVEATRERTADYEAEPNDDFVTAAPARPELGISGRSHLRDEDVLALEIEGETQAWRIEASGEQIYYLQWLRAGREVVAESVPDCDGSAAVLEDLQLAPGIHRFLVRACDGEYELTATPLGRPDPDAEREPNSDDVRAEPYALGQRRVGRLPSTDDWDYFRFTLAAPELIELRLRQPADASFRATLHTGRTPIFQSEATEPGQELVNELYLQAGDYLLELRPLTPSDGRYELTTTPLDLRAVAADSEPNDHPGTARVAPASLRWSGRQVQRPDSLDAVWLPPLTEPGPLRITVDGERPSIRLFHGPNRDERIDVEQQADGSFVATEAPTGVPLYLEVIDRGEYAVTLDAPGWTPAPTPVALPVTVAVSTAVPQLAAYWPEGQRVDAIITLTNEGDETLDLALATRTSHYAWELRSDVDAVTLEPGASVEVPAVVETRADLWADAPVRLSASAVAADGAAVTGRAEMTADRDAEAVGSHLAWPLPDALVGGLNVAGAALGGVPAGTVAPDREAFLFDDVTPAGAGFYVGHDGSPLELIVDLAGDAPVPVAGTILDPLARGSGLAESVRGFELALSTDGTTWEPVLRGQLSPLPIDQSFVLDAPIEATHARLRIESTHGTNPLVRGVALGEWKVIAEPGAVPDDMPANIAEPIRGGHVARHTPFLGGFTAWAGVLDDEMRKQRQSRNRETGETLELVVGFQEGRAAQVTELRWHDPEGSDESERVDEVEVAVTTGGPLGPWESVGTWSLDRAADGSVPAFTLEAPTWARYVRLAAPTPDEEVRALEFPGKLEVIERSTDDEYRSILAEWGYTSDRGPYEAMVPSVTSQVALDADAGDTPQTATPIESGAVRVDRAEILEDEDWHRITVPERENTLTIELEGIPSVGVELELTDADGRTLELPSAGHDGGREVYEFSVEPGDYLIGVRQPPFNVAFTFDTSGSMGPYLDFVLEGMRVFASDVQPGREMAMIIPVDRPPLVEAWQDQPGRLVAAVNDYYPVNESSNIEIGLLDSAAALDQREGTKAILAVADAETGTLDEAEAVWSAFSAIRPRVYTVHVGADSNPEETRNLMRAWSDANAGVYSYPTTHAEMERAFERMSTHLRRPSTYALTATTSLIDRRPAALRVVAPEGAPVGLAPGTGLALILDTSGSMNKRLDGKRRIDIAKAAMKQLVREGLADGVPVSLRVFGGQGKKTGCETRRLVELGPLRKARTVKLIDRLKIQKNTGTPIAAALRAVRDDLAAVEGERLVVLITDGKATCKEDPEAALEELRAAGIEVSLNIVGFALDDEAVKQQMRGWAEANRGQFFDAGDADGLTEAVAAAVAAPVDVYRVGDGPEPVMTTSVGAPAIELPPGAYRLEVRTDPPQVVHDIELAPASAFTLELEPPAPE